MSAQVKNPLKFFIKLLLLFSLTGCAAGALVSEAGIEGMVVRSVIGEAAAGAETFAGVRMASLAADAIAENAAGELFVTNELAANQLLEDVMLKYTKGESPKLYEVKSGKPFAEIYTRRKVIRFANGKEMIIPRNVLSVEKNGVNIRKVPKTSSDIVGVVNKRDMVIQLAKEDDWYHIRFIRKSKACEGWIYALYATPLTMLGSDDDSEPTESHQPVQVEVQAPKPKPYDCAEMRTGECGFTNKTNKPLTVIIYPGSMPSEYIGSPGTPGKQMTLSAYEQKVFNRLPADIYRYRVLEERPRGSSNIGQIDYTGEIEVKTCEKSNYDIKQ
jgi:hypothetical protein